MTTTKILGPNEVTNPQLMQYLFTDPDGNIRRCSIYTGLLTVGHGAGDLTPLDIVFPLIGNFGVFADQPGIKGILPLSNQEFRAATITCSIATIIDSTDVFAADVHSFRVQLAEIQLDQPKERINALLLFARVQAASGELRNVGYQANVLERLSPDIQREPPADANSPSANDQLDLDLRRAFHPRLLNEPPFNWNGQYQMFNDSVVVPASLAIDGTPQGFD